MRFALIWLMADMVWVFLYFISYIFDIFLIFLIWLLFIWLGFYTSVNIFDIYIGFFFLNMVGFGFQCS